MKRRLLKRLFLRAVTSVARLPMLADRRGFRWLLSGRVMPGGPIAVLTHRGRRSGKRYRTVLEVFGEIRERGELILLPARRQRSDWYQNVLAGGAERLRLGGRDFDVEWRVLSPDEIRDALEHYRREHPLWGRMILTGMALQYRVPRGDFTAMAKAQPLVALRPI